MFLSRHYFLILVGDAICLAFALFWVTFWRRLDDLSWNLIEEHVKLYTALIPGWLWIFHLCGFYEVRYFRRLPSAVLTTGIFVAFLASSMAFYFLSNLFEIPAPKTILVLGSILAWTLLYFWRDRMAVWLGLRMDKADTADAISALLGSEIFVVERKLLMDPSRDGYHDKLREAGLRGVPVLTDRALSVFQTGKIAVDDLEPVWLVERVLAPDFGNIFYRVMKRILDIALAVLVLPFALAACAVVAACVFAVLGRPVLYRQQRIGLKRRLFTLWKFRTMKETPHGAGSWVTAPQDPRIPPSLRWIRRLHLDELPQIFNILKGDMSWVGPRPEQEPVTRELEDKIQFYWVRHIVPPGLTGWAQVNMGYAGDFEAARDRFAYDLYYLAHRSVALDTSILLRTFRTLISADGR